METASTPSINAPNLAQRLVMAGIICSTLFLVWEGAQGHWPDIAQNPKLLGIHGLKGVFLGFFGFIPAWLTGGTPKTVRFSRRVSHLIFALLFSASMLWVEWLFFVIGWDEAPLFRWWELPLRFLIALPVAFAVENFSRTKAKSTS